MRIEKNGFVGWNADGDQFNVRLTAGVGCFAPENNFYGFRVEALRKKLV